MIRPIALATAIAVSLLAVSGAGGAPAQTPKRGGTVVIATGPSSEPACLNVLLAACSLVSLDSRKILPGAYELTSAGTFRSDLAAAEIVARKPFTLVYRIRPEARWSDKVPISSQDFEFSYQALRKHQPEGYESQYVRSVRPIDRKSLKVVLRAPVSDWRRLFSVVLPSHVLAGQDLEGVWRSGIDDPTTRKPIGSGPFLVGPWKRGEHLTLVRNPRYWGAHAAYLESVVYRFLPADGLAEAVRRGEADMVDPNVGLLQSEAFELLREREPGIKVLTSTSSSYEQLAIRIGGEGHPALKMRPVRQALAYGIDRVAIARALGKLSLLNEEALEPLDSVVFLNNSPQYRPNWNNYRLRQARARALLERAGCRRGDDEIYVCAGRRLLLRLGAVAGNERRAHTLLLAQRQLRRIGVDATLEFHPVRTWITQVIPSGDFDVGLWSWIVSVDSPPADVYGCQGESNHTGYCDRLITRELVQAARMVDDRRLAGRLHMLDARLAQAVPAIPLFQGKGLWAMRVSVRGVGLGSGWDPEDWWLER